jgi:hypothetical protein
MTTTTLAAGRWFPAGTLISSTDVTDRHDITEILLNMALNTITPSPNNKQMTKNLQRFASTQRITHYDVTE